MPIAFLMGVEWADCQTVARLLGLKTFINEFVAYEQLAQLINNRKQCEGPTISVSGTLHATCSHQMVPWFSHFVAWNVGGAICWLLFFWTKCRSFQIPGMLCTTTKVCLQIRSEIITTYALCGFANLASIGVQLGGIGPMAPSRKSDLAALAFRALVCGTTACFITATVAGTDSCSGSNISSFFCWHKLQNIWIHALFFFGLSLQVFWLLKNHF